MKKILALFLALTMVIGMATGCSLLTNNEKDEPSETVSNSENTKPVTETPDEDTWSCAYCKKENNGKFCSDCGSKKPSAEDETQPEATEPVETQPDATEPTQQTPPEPDLKPFSDPFGFEISINGTTVKLPSTVADFEALGFKMDEEKRDKTIDDGYGTACNAYKGDSFITLSIYNNTGSPIKFSEAKVDDVSFTKITGNNIYIYGNLKIGSTKAEVMSAYGEPTRSYGNEGESYSSLTYEGESFRQKIEFQFNNDIVSGISITSDGEYK